MKFSPIYALLFTLLFVQCKKDDNGGTESCTRALSTSTTTDDDIEIVKAVMVDFQGASGYLIQETRDAYNSFQAHDRVTVDSTTIESCELRNEQKGYFPVQVFPNLQTIPFEEYECRTAHLNIGEHFYPSRFDFCLPGYNDTRTEAYIEVAEFCGGLCFISYMVVLEKVKTTWQVKEKVITAIA